MPCINISNKKNFSHHYHKCFKLVGFERIEVTILFEEPKFFHFLKERDRDREIPYISTKFFERKMNAEVGLRECQGGITHVYIYIYIQWRPGQQCHGPRAFHELIELDKI